MNSFISLTTQIHAFHSSRDSPVHSTSHIKVHPLQQPASLVLSCSGP